GVDEGGHRPANPFYIGPAAYLAPALFVLRLLLRFPAGTADVWRQGCSGPLVAWTGVVAPIAVGFTMCFAYRIGRRWFSEVPCAMAVLVVGLASPLNVFGSLTWYYSHLYAALTVAIALLAIVRADECPEKVPRWFYAGAATAFAALMR